MSCSESQKLKVIPGSMTLASLNDLKKYSAVSFIYTTNNELSQMVIRCMVGSPLRYPPFSAPKAGFVTRGIISRQHLCLYKCSTTPYLSRTLLWLVSHTLVLLVFFQNLCIQEKSLFQPHSNSPISTNFATFTVFWTYYIILVGISYTFTYWKIIHSRG